ncbi:alanine--tRNA ligase [Candidatus Micrarchaeota archaeon]|nr:alanine--tRNA ligase [Candidatus Micrarchaeota archaeon]
MITKDSLKKEFAANYKKFYEIPFFKEAGFERKVCPKCGRGFWSAGREDCGNSVHEDYSFFRKPPRKETYSTFWKKYADFWKKHRHTIINRYPVLSRWRDDLYFTNASIVDFQRLENGRVVFEYPANPLIVPQICLRFNDLANVGVTGRHMSCFTMAGQHAFNPPREGYWKEKCLELNYKFLTEVLELKKEEITYVEDVWAMPDFSAFGPCMESFAKGLELVNSVFMQYTYRNGHMEELSTKVIDVGWGFERLPWFYNGSLTVYDAVFSREIAFMKEKSSFDVDEGLLEKYAHYSARLDVEEAVSIREEKERIAKALGIPFAELEETISPLQGIYAIADHSRALLFALTDGAIPSNTAGGYNLRVVARRAMGFITEFGFDFDLMDVIGMIAEDLKKEYPELLESLCFIDKILEVEKRKYQESFEKARKTAGEVVARGESPSVEKLIMLYESHGITPELLEKVGKEVGKEVTIPSEFYHRLTERHLMEERKREELGVKAPSTKLVYYEKSGLFELDAEVVARHGNALVLDKTIFYPEGGGQMFDLGLINGAKVVNVQKSEGIVLHYLKNGKELEKFKVGQKVRLKIDVARRKAIQMHHSATHVLISSARDVLGKHVWQAGSKKDEDVAHVDITHYDKLSKDERGRIESLANERVFAGKKIGVKEMERGKAEKKYGFRLYQGGGAIGKKIRIVEIEGIDVEACGGLHCSNTSELGFIKIVGTEQVQDGIVRLYFKAGEKALKYVQAEETLLEESCSVLNVQKDALPSSVKRFFEEWKERGKALEEVQLELAGIYAVELKRGLEHTKLVEKCIGRLSQKLVEKITLEIAREDAWCGIISNSDGFICVACHPLSGKSAVSLLKERGRGGGDEGFARGKIF